MLGEKYFLQHHNSKKYLALLKMDPMCFMIYIINTFLSSNIVPKRITIERYDHSLNVLKMSFIFVVNERAGENQINIASKQMKIESL